MIDDCDVAWYQLLKWCQFLWWWRNHGNLHIDVSNALYSINRAVALHNMDILCPEFASYVYNCYQIPERLFISGGKELQSEGTTQGDPIGMGIYATGVFPLLHLNEMPNEMNRKKNLTIRWQFHRFW